jgi:hypothetical protein
MHRLFGFGGGGTGSATSKSPHARDRNNLKEESKDSKQKNKVSLIEEAFNADDLATGSET